MAEEKTRSPEFQRRVCLLAIIEKAIDQFNDEWKSHKEASDGKNAIVMEIDTIIENEVYNKLQELILSDEEIRLQARNHVSLLSHPNPTKEAIRRSCIDFLHDCRSAIKLKQQQ